MDTSRAIVSSGTDTDSEDALEVLGRVADAFDNPGPLHKADKDVLFVVNVVKSRHLLPSLSSEGSVGRDEMRRSYASSSDSGSDEDVEVVELGDVGRWEHARFSEQIFRQDDGMYDITKMLLTSSPLDRLDRLARMELKKTGWFERTDKWSILALGLQKGPLPATSSGDGKQHCPEDDPKYSPGGKSDTPTGTDSYLDDFSTLSFAVGRAGSTSRPAQRGRFGQIVRSFVRRMLPREESRWSGQAACPATTTTRWSGFWH